MKRLICFFRGHRPITVANLGGGYLKIRCTFCGTLFIYSRAQQVMMKWDADFERLEQETNELIESLKQANEDRA